ncbi:MAG TPA: 3'-5' exonuclease [Holophagaceae bacterium]|nr:3'-5' exonuclease [Holophagaceae bacterium]
MLRPPSERTLCLFDCEWVPDAATGRRVYDLPAATPDAEVLERMWAEGGGTEADPRPYLKTVLCRVVSLAAVIRESDGHDVKLRLFALPDHPEPMEEGQLLSRFLVYLADKHPQLVGFNSREADLPILVQRAMVHGLSIPGLGRPADHVKPWDAGPDFFNRFGNQHVDLREVLTGFGKTSARLHELATACGIPGKLGTDGSSVVDLWVAGDLAGIVRYNLFDACTTYLLWLRAMSLAGFISPEQRRKEEGIFRQVLEAKAQADPPFGVFLEAWDRLKA